MIPSRLLLPKVEVITIIAVTPVIFLPATDELLLNFLLVAVDSCQAVLSQNETLIHLNLGAVAIWQSMQVHQIR